MWPYGYLGSGLSENALTDLSCRMTAVGVKEMEFRARHKSRYRKRSYTRF